MKAQRRRGEELETALLQAAWDELIDVGFAKLTMDSVAARARTGVAVLYRRWPRKDDLVIAAIRHYGDTNPVAAPDMGGLRDDLLALMRAISDQRLVLTSVATSTLAGLLTGSGLTPAQIRDRVMDGRPLFSTTEIFRRACARGELDLDKIPPAVLAMPFELMRHDLLMTLEPIPQQRILEIIDDLFLPLITANR
jgi:AcrR family transcriptional regulator